MDKPGGGFDHADVHTPTNRLRLAHKTNDSVDIIDCAQDRYIESVRGLHARRPVAFLRDGSTIMNAEPFSCLNPQLASAASVSYGAGAK